MKHNKLNAYKQRGTGASNPHRVGKATDHVHTAVLYVRQVDRGTADTAASHLLRHCHDTLFIPVLITA
jgi:hypothetical protein